jgi:integrase
VKPKVTYAEFVAAQEVRTENTFAKGTVAWVVQRMILDIASQESMKQLGVTHLYGLRAIQRMPIGSRKAAELKRPDFIEFVKWRRQEVGAATANQTISMLRGAFKYASATWADCEDLGGVVVEISAAMPYLQKHSLVSKSTPRTRRPTEEEIAKLLAYYEEHPGRVIRMPDIIAFALVSSRRISEICRITHGDVDYDTATYWVRDLKHPTKKKGNDKEFLLFPVIEQIIRRQPRLRPDDPSERVFPFIPECVSQSFITAKKAVAAETGDPTILTLRLHDHRAEAISKWLLSGMPPEDVRLAVSGHNDTRILETVYDRRGASDLKKKYLPQPAA